MSTKPKMFLLFVCKIPTGNIIGQQILGDHNTGLQQTLEDPTHLQV